MCILCLQYVIINFINIHSSKYCIHYIQFNAGVFIVFKWLCLISNSKISFLDTLEPVTSPKYPHIPFYDGIWSFAPSHAKENKAFWYKIKLVLWSCTLHFLHLKKVCMAKECTHQELTHISQYCNEYRIFLEWNYADGLRAPVLSQD